MTHSPPPCARGGLQQRRRAAAADGAAVVLWDAATGKEVRRLKRHPRRLRALAFSPDGTLLATGSDDSTVLLWDAAAK